MRFRFVFLLPLALLLYACGPLPVVAPLPIPATPMLIPTYSEATLDRDTVPRITELTQLRAAGAGPVAALAFTSDGQELLAVHGQEGKLRRWRVTNGAPMAVFDVGPVGMAAVSFDGVARLLAVGAGCTPPAVQAGYDAPVKGVRIWDTLTGQLVHEFATDLQFSIVQLSDVALSPKGDRLLGVEPGSLDGWNLTTGKTEIAVVRFKTIWEGTPGPDSSVLRTVTFDPTGEWFAMASEDGFVEVEKWDHWRSRGDQPGGIRVGPSMQSPGIPLALAIDPSRHWIAEVTDKSLHVWNLQAWFGSEALKSEVMSGPLAALAFSPDGDLLAVGTAGGWQIWSVGDWKLLAQGPQQATYAVTFSPDGRLFAWGDVDGVVHLWGVP